MLQVFLFNNQEVRFVGTANNPWWVAADVCAVLEHSNPSAAIARLDEDEKGINSVYTLGGEQEMLCINESGLYSLILTSRKPQAKAFKKWVTSEVLPSIRKTGSYLIAPKPEPLQLPPPQVQVTNLVVSLEKLGIDLQNPRIKSGLQDLTLDILGINQSYLPTSDEKWYGVVERAEQLGYPTALVVKTRSQLGRFVAKFPLTRKQEERKCNGTDRAINLYLVCPELDDAIAQFFKQLTK